MPNNADVLGLGLPKDNNFQSITSFVSLALLGNEIVVSVTLFGKAGNMWLVVFENTSARFVGRGLTPSGVSQPRKF